jgi:uncharacterized protein YjdB
MKKIFQITVYAVLTVVVALFSCREDDGNIPITKVDLNKTTLSIAIDASERLYVTVYPEDATDKRVRWYSENPSIATVDQNGLVKGVSVGVTVIRLTNTSNKTFLRPESSCAVSVHEVPVPVTGVSLGKTATTISVNGVEELNYVITPVGATNRNVTWVSNNTEVVTVDGNGKITGIATGKATVTVTTEDGEFRSSCVVTVQNEPVAVTGVSLGKTSTTISVNGSEDLAYVVIPSNATNKNVTWSSNNTSAVTVDGNGRVTGIAEGTATVSVTSDDGQFSASCAVTVQALAIAATGVSLDKAATSVSVNGVEDLAYTVVPANATNKNVVWSSNNTSVVTVDGNGRITGLVEGTATVTVMTEDGLFGASCVVTVQTQTIAVTGVSMGKTSTTISVNGVEDLQYTIVPANATNKDVTWSSNNTSVATVDGNGRITGVAAGSATVTVTSDDGQFGASCVVTVQTQTIAVTGISTGKTSTTVSVNGVEDLTHTIVPANATNKSVTWSSNDVSVATVDGNGRVTGVAAGTATVTVTSDDGQFGASCVVTVQTQTIAVTGVSLNRTTATVTVNGVESLTGTLTPSNASNKGVTWSSNDVSVATVDGNGRVAGVAAGTATVTVTSDDGGFTASCIVTVQEPTVAVTGVSLGKAATTVYAGEVEDLTYTVSPDNATNTNVVWSSSNTSVATVDGNGRVTGVAAGTTIVTVTSSDDGRFYANCVVTVSTQTVAVTGVALDRSTVTVYTGDTETLICTVSPDNAANKKVVWSSSAMSVAPVDNKGRVTGVAAGTATVTVTSEDGEFTASCTVTVQAPEVAVTGIALSRTTATVYTGEAVELSHTVAPANASNTKVVWSSADVSIATVDGNGRVTGVAAGTTVITVTSSGDGQFYANCAVTVQDPAVAVTGVSLSKTATTVYADEFEDLTHTVTPADATNKNVVWSSANTSVATVDGNGRVTGVAVGTTVITVTSSDNGRFYANCVVTVKNPTVAVTGISLDKTSLTLSVNGSEDVTHTVTPLDATNTNVTWSSNRTSVATVDNTGRVTGVAAGTATVTVTTDDGLFSASCVVTVQEAAVSVTGVSLDRTALTVYVNDVENLTHTVIPSTAVNTNVAWSSNATSVATVDNAGRVTGIAPGTASVTVTTDDGHFSASCVVTVREPAVPVTAVTLDHTALDIYVGDVAELTAEVSPANATDKSLTWKSSAASVAKVDSDGRVTGVSAGTATITVTSVDGELSSTCTVKVIDDTGNDTSTGWSAPSPNSYEYWMTYVAQVAFRGTLSTDTNVEVAAFVGNELRGHAKLVYESRLKIYLVHLTIYSKSAGNETVTLRVFNPQKKRIYENCKEFTFQGNASLGSSSEILNCIP